MKQKNTKKKIAPIIWAGIMIVLMLLIIISFLSTELTLIMANGIFGFYVLMFVAIIVGVILALRERLKEIDGGEEDEAKKY